MNTFKCIDIDYLRASRTIEVVEVLNKSIQKIFYVYNYEGYSFRVFKSIVDLLQFFQGDSQDYLHFDTEEELDYYFYNVTLVQ